MSDGITAIAWADCYRTGIDEIDREHERMVSNFNAAVSAIRTTSDHHITARVLDNFIMETAKSFVKEEGAMAIEGFDDLDLHRERHQHYLSRLDFLREKMSRGSDISLDLMGYFASWVSHHVSVTDRKFGDFLKERRGG